MNRILFSDFETTGQGHAYDHVHVSIYYISVLKSYGYNLDSFFAEKWKNNDVIYFHNLSFDGEFIIQYLIKKQFPFKLKLGKQRAFTFLKSVKGIIYTIGVRLSSTLFITFKDSYKIIPKSVEDIGNFLGYPKGEIDYDIFNKLHEAKDKEQFCKENPNLKIYLKRDVDIVENYLNQVNKDHKIFPATTIGSLAVSSFMPYHKYITKFCYNINENDWNVFLLGYFGGFVNYNPKYFNKVVEGTIYHYDVNSIYPYIMKSKKLPYGKALTIRPPKECDYLFFKIRVVKIFKVTKIDHNMINHFPFRRGNKITYLKNKTFTEPLLCSFGEEEWKELNLTYKIEFQDLLMYYFRKKYLFKDFINKWEGYKKSYDKNDPNYMFTKLIQNSLYGKLGQKSIFLREILDDNYQDETIFEKTTHLSPIYIASTITSLARCLMLRLIRLNYDKFIYCDTDSVVGFFTLPPQIVSSTEYGKWKLECVYNQFKVLKQKCYLGLKTDGTYKSAVSGMNKKTQKLLNFDNFHYGSTFIDSNLKCFRVAGGRILIPSDFVIKNESSELS